MVLYRLLCICFLLILPVPLLSAADRPQLSETAITFDNGKVISYKSFHRQHQKAIDAYRKNEPIFYREQVVIVDKWQRVIVAKYMNFFEGGKSQITVYDFQGKLLNTSKKFRGSVLISEDAERIFLGQRDHYYQLKESYLLDKDGVIYKTIKHEKKMNDFRMTNDGKLFVMIKNPDKDNKVYRVFVIDAEGVMVKKLETDAVDTISFKHNDIEYNLTKKKEQ